MSTESQTPIPAHQGRPVVIAAGGMAGAAGKIVHSRRSVRTVGSPVPYTIFTVDLDTGGQVDVPADQCLILFGPVGRPCHEHDWTQTAVFAMLGRTGGMEVTTCRRCGQRSYRKLTSLPGQSGS